MPKHSTYKGESRKSSLSTIDSTGQPDRKSAIRMARLFIGEFQSKYRLAIKTLRESLEDSFQFYALEEFDPKKGSSTNTHERLNMEIRRRSRVAGIFPSDESYVRLVTSSLIEYSEEWSVSRSYIKAESIDRCRARLEAAA
jgi:putative transposase